MINQKINTLPVPTWNRMGVNWAEKAAYLPEETLPAGKSVPCSVPLPSRISQLAALPAGVADIESGMGKELDSFVKNGADNTFFFQVSGQVSEPLSITHSLDTEQPLMRNHWGIIAEEKSSLTVVQITRGDAPHGIFTSLTQIEARPDSLVRLIQVELLGEKSRSWNAVGARIGKGAKVELIRVILGGRTAACGSLAMLEDYKGAYELNTAYFGHQDQYLDFNDIARHIGRETSSELYTAGALADESSKILRGTIDFIKGAARSVGHENENVLLLSSSSRNKTVPLILCGEEQVEGQHAATLGRFDEKQLYYLTSRGLSQIQAKRLMVEARFTPILDQLPDKALRAEILELIERRLERHESKQE